MLPGSMAAPVGTGLDLERDGVGGLATDRHDAPTQVCAGAQRIDHVEEVSGHQRGRKLVRETADTVSDEGPEGGHI